MLLLRPALLIAAAAALAGCIMAARPVAGIPTTAPWFALPLDEWLGEGRAEPEAIAICRPPDCGPGLVAGVVRLSGADAEVAERILADPAPLANALRKPSDRKVRTTVAMKPLQAGAAGGFAMTLGRADGKRRPAYAAALGRRSGGTLQLVLVIGEEPGAVEDTARRVAREHLGA